MDKMYDDIDVFVHEKHNSNLTEETKTLDNSSLLFIRNGHMRNSDIQLLCKGIYNLMSISAGARTTKLYDFLLHLSCIKNWKHLYLIFHILKPVNSKKWLKIDF